MRLFDERFKDAPWYTKCKQESILVVGVGGIGSNAIYSLAKTIPATYFLLDFDKVEEHNVGTQFFNEDQIGWSKVGALTDTLSRQSNAKIHCLSYKYGTEYKPITITGLDNMETRKQAFEVWRCKPDRELFIDGRLRANYYEIFAVTPGKEDEYEKTLFDDSRISEGPCTFKQTAYFAVMIGARITHILVNYLINKYSTDPIHVVPYKITEFGDMFNMTVE